MGMKEAIMGLAIGVGIFVTVVLGADALKPHEKVSVDGTVACYEVVSIKPELGVAVFFNVCTGQFGLSQFPSDIRRKENDTGPAPKDTI